MNVIQGVQNDIEQGIIIQYDRNTSGLISMRNQEEVTFRIRTQSNITTISTDECVLDIKHLSVPQWECEDSIFPSYVTVSKGRLSVRNDGYWIMGGLVLFLVRLYW